MDFCQSLFKAWANIKKHYHNDFNSDRNSLHVKFTKKFYNVISSIAVFLSAADGKLDLIWLQSCLKRKIKIHVEIDFLQVLIWKNLKLSNLLTVAFFLCLYLYILVGFTGWIQSLSLANLNCQGCRNCAQAFGFVRRDRKMRDFTCYLLATNHCCSEPPEQCKVETGGCGEREVLAWGKGQKWPWYFTLVPILIQQSPFI